MKVTRSVRDILRARITAKLTELVKASETPNKDVYAERNAAILSLIDQHGSKCLTIHADHTYDVDCADDFELTPFFKRELKKIGKKYRVKEEPRQHVHFAGLNFYLHDVPLHLRAKFEKLSTAIDTAILGDETKDLLALVAKL